MLDTKFASLEKLEGSLEIDYVTKTGSAFGVLHNGDQVFLNARIMEKMGLFEGDNCHAVMIKNFEDKRDITPWRAVRVLTYFDETQLIDGTGEFLK